MPKNNKTRALFTSPLRKIDIYSHVHHIKAKIEVDHSSLCTKKYCAWILCTGYYSVIWKEIMQDRKIWFFAKFLPSSVLLMIYWLITMNVYYQCTKPENTNLVLSQKSNICCWNQNKNPIWNNIIMETDTHAIKNNGGFYLLKMYRYIQIKILFIW